MFEHWLVSAIASDLFEQLQKQIQSVGQQENLYLQSG